MQIFSRKKTEGVVKKVQWKENSTTSENKGDFREETLK